MLDWPPYEPVGVALLEYLPWSHRWLETHPGSSYTYITFKTAIIKKKIVPVLLVKMSLDRSLISTVPLHQSALVSSMH